jgi:Prokaryotic dksA/traR C4-type zinc finger
MAPVKTGAFLTLGDAGAGEPGPVAPRRGRETTMSAEQRFCKRCGEQIPKRRLEVLPHTRLCLDCSQEIGGDFKTYAVPENTGKPGSLKKNYGSWKVTRKLRNITPKDR